MIWVFIFFFLAFIFFLFEKKWKIHAAVTSGFLTLVLTLMGFLSPAEVYAGFSENAVITVVLMLILTGALERSGIVELFVHTLVNAKVFKNKTVPALFILVCFLSAIMNDIGALAIVMPVSLVVCYKLRIPQSLVLMPLSFGALLGGLLTKVGTPPNLIISGFRESEVGKPFEFFDYTPVGLIVCIVGGITILSLRKIVFRAPRYNKINEKNFSPLSRGFIPLEIPIESPLVGRKIGASAKFNAELVFPRLVLRKQNQTWKCFFSKPWDVNLMAGDVIMIKIDSNQELAQKEFIEEYVATDVFKNATMEVQEDICSALLHVCSVDRKSSLLNVSQSNTSFREEFYLLPLREEQERKEEDTNGRNFFPGKVLTFLGDRNNFEKALTACQLIELNAPKISIDWPRLYTVLGVFLGAITISVFGVMRLEHALGLAILLLLAFRELDFTHIAQSVDVALIVLIATMMVNAEAFATSGAADQVVSLLIFYVPENSPRISLALLILGTIVLTNIISNAACANMMAPIAIKLAATLESNPDPYLMGVCVAASCAFLTPIGHQCNLLVYRVGDYDFSCYFKLGVWVSLAVWLASSLSIPLLWDF